MSLPLSTLAIRNPIPSIIFFLLITFAGLASFNKLPINSMPSVVIPFVAVNVYQDGAAATEIETQITRKIEAAISGINGLKHIDSVISQGSSQTTIEFDLSTNIDRAISDVKDAVTKIRNGLPKSITEPIVTKIDYDNSPILTYLIESPEMIAEDLSWFVDDYLSRELLAVNGVSKIMRGGGVKREITLNLDPTRLIAHGTSAADVSAQISSTNKDFPAGMITIAEKEYFIRILASAKSLESLNEMSISFGNGKKVRLGDLGELKDVSDDSRYLTKLNNRPVMTFYISKTKSSSEILVTEKVEKKLSEISKTYPNIKFKQIFSLAEYTKDSFQSTLNSFIEGAILTILVVFIFLGDKRATIIAAITIPLSIIPTFFIIDLLGFTINVITLLAISLVTGVLVDDAIVEIENIYRYMQKGKEPLEASIIAAEEIGLAVVATTLVICAVFIPVSFIDNMVGQYFKQFGLTVAIAAFFSLLVARLLTPMLCAYFLKAPKHSEGEPGYLLLKYKSLIEWTLNHRLKTMLSALIILIFSIAILPFLSYGFTPYEDSSESRLRLELPPGSTINQTDLVSQKITDILRARAEVEYVLSSIAENVNIAELTIKLLKPERRKLSQRDFEQDILASLKSVPDIKVNFSNSQGYSDISIILASDYITPLMEEAEKIEREMKTIPGLSGVGIGQNSVQDEIIIVPDHNKIVQVGISLDQLSRAITVLTMGDSESNLASFDYNNRQVPIIVKVKKNGINSIDLLENIRIPTTLGSSVSLGSVAKIHIAPGPSKIERRDRERKIAIEANLNGISLGDALSKIYSLPSFVGLNKQVHLSQGGDIEAMNELFSGFKQAIILGLFLVYLVQVLLYKDWIQPITRMAALPLSLGGTFFLLLITGTELNMPSFIGILMLMGIADKNSILLVDYMIELIKKGVPRNEAILNSCLVRVRPIIMTSCAMLAGMLPIMLGISGNAFRYPMAIAVSGGLISSTILSLVLVPVMFSYVRDFEEWLIPRIKLTN